MVKKKSTGVKSETAQQIVARVTKEASALSQEMGQAHIESFNAAVAEAMSRSPGIKRYDAVLSVADQFPPIFESRKSEKEFTGFDDYKYSDFFDSDGNALFKPMRLPELILWVANHANLKGLPASAIPHPGVLPILRVAIEDPLEFAKTFLVRVMPSSKAIDAMGARDTSCESEMAVLDDLDVWANELNSKPEGMISDRAIQDVLTILLDEKLQAQDILLAAKDRVRTLLKGKA